VSNNEKVMEVKNEGWGGLTCDGIGDVI